MRRIIPIRWLVVAAAGAALCACSRDGAPGSSPPPGASAGRTARDARTAPGLTPGDGSFPGAPPESKSQGTAAADGRPAILFLGTSLTAGLGLDPDQAYSALIQRKLDSAGLRWRAINGGVSGETSAGALRRLGWILHPDVRVLMVETGANDGLRGLDVDSTRANLEGIVRQARTAVPGIRIVLAGMEAPPNLGATYTSRFRAVFRDLARREHLAFIPFILAGVGGVDSLNQADGIHPNVKGERIVAANVWRVLEPVIREADAKGK
jgi:acyl-CoA thioesterase-1